MACSNLHSSILVGSEEIFDFFCQPCSPEKHVEAVGYCQDCSEYLCTTCAECHGKLSMSKTHTVLDKSAMPKTNTPTRIQHTDTLTEKCRKHPDKIIEYFCQTHDRICCSVCITLDHGTCSGKSYIPDVSKFISKNREYKTLKADLDRLLMHITKQQEQKNEIGRNYEKNHSEALANIREFRQQVNELLDKIEADTQRKVNELSREVTEAIKRATDKYQSLLSDVKAMAENIDTIVKAGRKNQLFVQVKLVNHRIAEIEAQLTDESDECTSTLYAFDKDEKLQQMMSSLSDIWSLSVRQDGTATSASNVKEINVKTDEDKKLSYITGIAFLAKDRVVVADSYNRSLKLYDMTVNKLLSRLSLPSRTYDICEMNTNQVALALGTAKEIQVIYVSTDLTTSHYIKTPGACITGLCYNGSAFIAACQSPGSVKIIDTSGNTLSTFTTDSNNEKLFIRHRYVALLRDTEYVYITDHKTNMVTCFTLTGRVIWVFRHDELKYPLGVAVDKNGMVYVCSRDTDTVHQLTPTGELKQILLGPDQGVQCPVAMTYCEEDNMLYISSGSKRSEKCYHISRFPLE